MLPVNVRTAAISSSQPRPLRINQNMNNRATIANSAVTIAKGIHEISRTCKMAIAYMISPGFQSCAPSLNTLRYANRVKELAADNSEMKLTEEDEDMVNGDEMELLQANSNDDFFTSPVHQAISHLTELKEEVLDMNKNLYENCIHRWTKEHEKLINLSSEVDYDVNAYAQNLEKLLNEQVDFLLKSKERIKNFKTQLGEDEQMSKTAN